MRHPTPARLRAASPQAESILRICPCVFAAGWMLSWRFGYFVPGPNPAVSLFNESIEIAHEFAVRVNRYNSLKLLTFGNSYDTAGLLNCFEICRPGKST
jgi:hypothetical protein